MTCAVANCAAANLVQGGLKLRPDAPLAAGGPLADLLAGPVRTLMVIAAVATAVAVANGLLRLLRRRGSQPLPTISVAPAAPRTGAANESLLAGESLSAPAATGLPRTGGAARRVCAGLHDWFAHCEDQPDLWASFDQLVRELLAEQLGATRVRCYHVRPGDQTLQTIAQSGRGFAARGPKIHDSLLGHVATTGREFVAGDPGHGPLLEDLAARSSEQWSWIWPVRENQTTIGIVAVGQMSAAASSTNGGLDPRVLPAEERQAIGQLISICWQHVACRERLRLLRRTDQASGVLTRGDFFTLGAAALADSYRCSEPVVVAVVALEGLRGLDDSGRWRERDLLIERLGPAIVRCVRSDDLVGRFADDRFVVLLRRLDAGLGRLIAEKILAAAQQCASQFAAASPEEGRPPAAGPGVSGAGRQPLVGLPPSDGSQRMAERSTADLAPAAHWFAAANLAGGGPVRMRVGLAGSGLAQPGLGKLLVAAFSAVQQARQHDLPVAVAGADSYGYSPQRISPEVDKSATGPPSTGLAVSPSATGRGQGQAPVANDSYGGESSGCRSSACDASGRPRSRPEVR